MDEIKSCIKCKTDFPATSEYFARSKRFKCGLYCYCKNCCRELNRSYQIKSKDKIRAYRLNYINENRERIREQVASYTLRTVSKRRSRILTKVYGLSEDQIMSMMNSQGGCCGVCGGSLVYPESGTNYHIDHDHSTGKVRGLLCNGCNVQVERRTKSESKFGDNVRAYLRKHEESLL